LSDSDSLRNALDRLQAKYGALEREHGALKREHEELRSASKSASERLGFAWFLEPSTEDLVEALSGIGAPQPAEAPQPAGFMSAGETREWIAALRRGDIDGANAIQARGTGLG
jgi:hypothetical protein